MAAAAAAAMLSVLGDDNLLGEILLRLAFPTYLVRSALACKRWLRVASDPAFLRRFRSVHLPRLLGFYANGRAQGSSNGTKDSIIVSSNFVDLGAQKGTVRSPILK